MTGWSRQDCLSDMAYLLTSTVKLHPLCSDTWKPPNEQWTVDEFSTDTDFVLVRNKRNQWNYVTCLHHVVHILLHGSVFEFNYAQENHPLDLPNRWGPHVNMPWSVWCLWCNWTQLEEIWPISNGQLSNRPTRPSWISDLLIAMQIQDYYLIQVTYF